MGGAGADSRGAMSRDKALLSMTTPLGKDVLMPIAMVAEECISRPFLVTVDMVSTQSAIDRHALIGQAMTVLVKRSSGDGTPDIRYFNGLVRRFGATGASAAGLWGYRVELVPGLWLLDRMPDCRVYETKTSIDILQILLQQAGQQSATVRTTETPAVREFTIQYNETGLDFVTRLLEEDGCFYFFEHDATSHKLVIANAASAYTALVRNKVRRSGAADTGIDALRSWQPTEATPFSASRLTDYDPTAPSKTLDATVNGTGNSRQRYEWPAGSSDASSLRSRARWRLEASEVEAVVGVAAGNDPGIRPAGTFSLTNDTDSSNPTYAVYSVVHRAEDGSWIAGGGLSTYANEFTAFLATLPWREPTRTPRPRMAGLFSATVIGPGGEEINVDKYGRIQVRLRFDYRIETTTNTVWARVVQPWTGDRHGWQHVPRIGSEVAVSFMDGDPDRPVIVGGLYNGDQMPIFTLPTEKMKTGLRTRSTANGGTADYSELSIDDTKGSEKVLLHAQKDHTLEVENDHVVDVKHDETMTVDNNRTRTVKVDESVTIQGNQTLSIEKKQSTTVTQDRSVTVSQGNDSLTVQIGNIAIKASAGAITIEAIQSITLTVGPSSVKIDPSGVKVSGLQISIEGQAMTTVKAPMTQVSGDGMLMMKGGLVMVN